MSGEASNVGLDAESVLSAESESSSRTISRRPTQSGSSLGISKILGSDKPRPPWKTTSSTPKLLEATRKVLKASRTGKISRPAQTQTEPTCVRLKDSSTQTSEIRPCTTRFVLSAYPPGQHYPNRNIGSSFDYAYELPPKEIRDLLKETTKLLRTFDKMSSLFYEPQDHEDQVPESVIRARNLEEDLMKSCRELEECVRRSELLSTS